jgi:hypothetical protein
MWITDAWALAYLATKPDGGALAASADRTKYYTEAYRQLFYDPLYSFPDPITSGTADEQDRMMAANVEQALALFNNPTDGVRAALQAQNVQSFTIGNFSESFRVPERRDAYKNTGYNDIVSRLIDPFRVRRSFGTNLTRQTNEYP